MYETQKERNVYVKYVKPMLNIENHHAMLCFGNKVNAAFILNNFDHVYSRDWLNLEIYI